MIKPYSGKGITHRQFKSLLDDVDAKYGDLLYHSNVKWLSLGKILKRVWDLTEEITMFLEMKGLECDFGSRVKCEEWKCEFMFAVDIFEKLNDLNISLQGKDLFAHEMYKTVDAFKSKLFLFSRQAGQGKFPHFSLLSKGEVPKYLLVKFSTQLEKLGEEFQSRFIDFKQMEYQFNLLSCPNIC